MRTLESLKKLIKAIPGEMLLQIGIPEDDVNIFSNYKIFPRGILVEADWNYKDDDELIGEKLRNNMKRIGQVENIQLRLLNTGYYEVINGSHRLKEGDNLGKQFYIAYDHGPISLAEAQRIATETNETRFKSNFEKLSKILNDLKIEFPEDDLLSTMPFSQDDFNNLLDLNFDNLSDLSNDIVEEDNFDKEPPVIAKTARGDLYEMNGHRMLCGDSTKKDDVDRLMNKQKAHMIFTDPPYNINYAEFNMKRGYKEKQPGKDWTAEYCTEWKDSMSDSDYKNFLIDFLRLGKENLIEFGHYYIWHATTYYRELLDALEINDITYDKVPLVWKKQAAPLSWAHYKRIHEPCLFAGKGAVNGAGNGARWFGPANETTVWDIPKDHNGSYIHPTQKPVALAGRAIHNSSQKGEIVLDLFLGSGSTLIASDKLERKCYGMEYEPKFCDVIVQRFFKYCTDNSKECTVKLNGESIDENYFL